MSDAGSTAPPTPLPTRLAFADALAAVLDDVAALPPERVPLRAALGRALAADVVSPVDLPPWDNAAMDGYAVRAADVRGASADGPVTLRVAGAIPAGGDASAVTLAPGDAARISTGAPVPSTADAVVRVEDTDGGAQVVCIVDDRDVRGDAPQRRNVRPRGEDVRAGARALGGGATIDAAALGVLASVGCATVPVARRPRVAIVSSGDELVTVEEFAEVVAGRRIVSSNTYTLEAQARLAGADVAELGFARDDVGAMRDRFAAALDGGCDVLVTSGGISVGEHDHTREALGALGLAQRFWRARIRPGGPLGFGVLPRPDGRVVRWLGLPGNPVSAMVTFELFGRPLLRRLGGHQRAFRRAVAVTLAERVATPAPLTHFLRASVDVDDDGRLVARLTGAQGSNLLTSMACADALLVVPEAVGEVPAGGVLRALLLGSDALDAEAAFA
ncbi:MAG: molybdopterin molybdotransferase MoeA [Gemmatirosa sp.]|nr:molybdopterin molybdotransferase MoeA [Gemmatirosa sp.]